MNLRAYISDATHTLTQVGIPSARLDALVLACDELGKNKAWILAHDDLELTNAQHQNLMAKINRRSTREPLSYIRGLQEFYGRDFAVTPDTLIPRPETEALIELLLRIPTDSIKTVVDIGTGSGIIAITAKLERPNWNVFAYDTSEEALHVAAHNADSLHAAVAFRLHDLLKNNVEQFDVIAANLPYVDTSWQRSPETNFEPPEALFAADHGLALIATLIAQAPDHMTPQGHLLLEADPEQHPRILALAQEKGLHHVQTLDYAVHLQRR